MPLLQVDGKKLNETMAIAQYLGGEFGLSGVNSWEAAQCTFIAGVFKDMIPAKQGAVFKAMQSGDKAALVSFWFWKLIFFSIFQDAATEEFVKDALPPYFERLEKILTANGGEWFVGKQVTWADLLIAEKNQLFASKADGKPIFANSPKLEAHYKRVYALPGIKEYAAARPDPPF